ncbi:uncharacterized protein STEHIDRAFT_124892 [Stereum hirsutum FP-91666 SS1]|uniref:uncharacterized protein n=1 Tax=Stereum hirsutum (strain FP-91666) TaxID=721885 RepID=UPI0004449284|nr:uncharacterized protein STEHIDRAFT_124892 [Stereum hirsutum FP-91666 SS1]EIM82081.1 hypothetical protein STEHIDRAFT_124892 [Stereum hirsutum FP-91666 SS1]
MTLGEHDGQKTTTTASGTKPLETTRCRIAEILQYSCDWSKKDNRINCLPFPRLFRICPGRPAVEITRQVRVDIKTGEVEIPPEVHQFLPKGKPWRDVVRYSQDESSEPPDSQGQQTAT